MRYDIRTITPAVFETDNIVVLDFETDTSHGDYGHPVHPENGIVLACWKCGPGHPWSKVWGDTGVKVCWADEYGMRELVDDIEAADLLVCHNAKYELGWLTRCGLDLKNVLTFCTKIAEYVLMGNLASGDELNAPRGTSLDDCMRRRGQLPKDPVVDTMIHHGVNPVNIPRPGLEGRCRQDVDSTEWLFHDQRRDLRESGRLGVALTRNLITPLLAEIELVGMTLDAERTEAAYLAAEKELAELSLQMELMTGGINWKSSTQIAEFLYNPTRAEPKFAEDEITPIWLVPNAKGREVEVLEGSDEMKRLVAAHVKRQADPAVVPEFRRAMTRPGLGFTELRKPNGEPRRTGKDKKLTDQKTIDALVATTEKQREFVALRKRLGKVNAALTKSLRFFQGACKENGGVFHAEINQTKTATHRTSSTGIPMKFAMYPESGPMSAQFQNLPNDFKRLFRARAA
jgi:hypothetical protein